MVSFHTPLSPTRRKMIQEFEVEVSSSKKRKLEESQTGEIPEQPIKPKSMKNIFDSSELHLEVPWPLEWQRCLDIKSGQIYFYNTRTHKREPSDARINVPEKLNSLEPGDMSLDLELNLPCGSVGKNKDGDHDHVNHDSRSKLRSFGDLFNNSTKDEKNRSFGDLLNNSTKDEKNRSGGFPLSPSWLTFEGDEREMVTAVCKKCHMLVMMCKSSPECPNCKFVHPADQSPPSLFSPG